MDVGKTQKQWQSKTKLPNILFFCLYNENDMIISNKGQNHCDWWWRNDSKLYSYSNKNQKTECNTKLK